MYGTVARIKTKPGSAEKLAQITAEWGRERGGKVEGAIGGYIYQMDADSNELIMAVLFSSREAYHSNADDPAQHDWYMQIRELMTEDPEWNDGEIIGEWHGS